MEIINLQTIATTIALSIIVQYFIDKVKYIMPEFNNDKIYSVYIGLLAFLLSIVLVLAFDIQMFTSNLSYINYILTALFIAGGSSAVHEVIGALNNMKNKDED